MHAGDLELPDVFASCEAVRLTPLPPVAPSHCGSVRKHSSQGHSASQVSCKHQLPTEEVRHDKESRRAEQFEYAPCCVSSWLPVSYISFIVIEGFGAAAFDAGRRRCWKTFGADVLLCHNTVFDQKPLQTQEGRGQTGQAYSMQCNFYLTGFAFASCCRALGALSRCHACVHSRHSNAGIAENQAACPVNQFNVSNLLPLFAEDERPADPQTSFCRHADTSVLNLLYATFSLTCSFLLLVAMPGAPSSVLVPSSDAFLVGVLVPVEVGRDPCHCRHNGRDQFFHDLDHFLRGVVEVQHLAGQE